MLYNGEANFNTMQHYRCGKLALQHSRVVSTALYRNRLNHLFFKNDLIEVEKYFFERLVTNHGANQRQTARYENNTVLTL